MLGPDATSHTFSVEPSTAYTFSIAASTSGGTGPYSDSFSVTSLDGSKWFNAIQKLLLFVHRALACHFLIKAWTVSIGGLQN